MAPSSTSRSKWFPILALLLAGAVGAGALYLVTSPRFGLLGGPRKSKKGEEEEDDQHATKGSRKTIPTVSVGSRISPEEQKARDALQAKYEALSREGVDCFKAGDFEKAIKLFTETLALGETSDSFLHQQRIVYQNRSACYEKLGKVDEALDDCGKILMRDYKNDKAMKRRERLFQVLMDKGDFQGALNELMVTFMLDLENYKTQMRLRLIREPPQLQPPPNLDEVAKKAAQLLIESIEAAGRPAPRNLPSGYTIRQVLVTLPSYQTLIQSKSTLRSVQDITDAINKAPDAQKTSLYYERALIHIVENRFKRAEEDLENAAQAIMQGQSSGGPQEAEILSWAGTFVHLRNDLDRAKLVLDRAGELNPANPEILLKRACLRLDRQELEEAKTMLDKLVEMAPEAAYVYIWRCQYHMCGQVTEEGAKEAEKELLKGLEYDENNVVALTRLMNVRMQQNKPEEAEKAIEKARKANPRNADVVAAHAEFLLMKGQVDEASKEFERAMRLDGTNPLPYVNKALISWQNSDLSEAKELLQRVITMDPLYQPAYAFLANLEFKTAATFDATDVGFDLIDKGISICRSKEDLEEMVQIKVLARAKIAAGKRLGMTSGVELM